jgi:sodium/proline symporter
MLGSLTCIEYLERRYPSPATRLIAAGLTVFLLSFYVLAQFIAGGKGMALVTGLPYWVALLVAVAVIIVYTFLGGYLAVAYTDFFQSLVMLVGVLWILAASIAHLGGLGSANRAIAAVDPSLLSVWGRDFVHQGQWGVVLGALLVFSIGYMGWPHVVTRHMACRGRRRRAWRAPTPRSGTCCSCPPLTSSGSWPSSSCPASTTPSWPSSACPRRCCPAP